MRTAAANCAFGHAGDLAVLGFLTLVFPTAITIFFIGGFKDPE